MNKTILPRRVGMRQLFNLPHRLKGDGLSPKEKEILQNTHLDDRAEAEYIMRANKVAVAIEQFIKRHDAKQILLNNPDIRSICHQNGKSTFTTYQYPDGFLPALSSILNAPYDSGGLCGWPSTADAHSVEVKLEAAYACGSIPDNPFIRLALFGRREEVISLGEKAHSLLCSIDLEVQLASAILLFAFKNTAEQELRLARLLYNTSAYSEDRALWEAANKYLQSIKDGHLPLF